MKILFVTTEFDGLIKAGGLGDVSSGLTQALRRRGIDIRVLMPAYRELVSKVSQIENITELAGRGSIMPCGVGLAQTRNGLPLYLVIAPELYERDGSPYCAPDGADWSDNDMRFGRLSLAAAQIAAGEVGLGWKPDLLHMNDWPSALAAAYLKWAEVFSPTLLTIHNIAYQGNFSAERCKLLGIPEFALSLNGVEFYGSVSFLKAGMYYSDHVCTVSASYAQEITTEALGAGLHGLTQGLASRGKLSAIANGIDETWDPRNSPYLPDHFSAENIGGKRKITEKVREAYCLRPSDGPLFGIVSRLVHQKGLDILVEAANDIIRDGGQIVILGIGEPQIEQHLSRASRRHLGHFALLIGFSEPMAHQVVSGSDFCLMPSRFEPGSLVQLQAQCSGTLPIAHSTGALAETIKDGVTGFLFSDLSPNALHHACRRALNVFGDTAELTRMQQAAMSNTFSWSNSAAEYTELYNNLINTSRAIL